MTIDDTTKRLHERIDGLSKTEARHDEKLINVEARISRLEEALLSISKHLSVLERNLSEMKGHSRAIAWGIGLLAPLVAGILIKLFVAK